MSNAESSSDRTLTIVAVPFYGDTIEAIYSTKDDTVYVSVRRVCENLDIDSDTQRRKLKGCHWAGTVIMTVPDQVGHPQELAFLPLVQLPMWLATISPSKIGAGPDMIAKLKRYQLEAVDVLAKHFVIPKPEPEDQDPIVMMAQAVNGLTQAVIASRQAHLELAGEVSEIKETVKDIVALRTAALQVLTEVPRSDQPVEPLTTRAKINMLVRVFVEAHGIEFAKAHHLERGDDPREVYRAVWNYLYREFYYRYHFDVNSRVKHAKNAKLSKLDVIEQAGKLDDFYAMVSKLLS